MDPIYVDVWVLAQTHQAVSATQLIDELTRLKPLLAKGDGLVHFTFHGHIDAYWRPAAKLSINTELSLACTHCEQPMSFALAVDKSYYFVRDESALNAIEIDIDTDEPLLGAHRFNLTDLIEEELILALPIGPRHVECQAQIDAKRPEEAVVAVDKARNTGPFSVLATLKKNDGQRGRR